jgi:type IV pilus assembly protein PilA
VDHNKGFTVIELMAVVSIVSILAVVAIPVYLDYLIRSKVSEGMVFVAEAKTSVSEHYYNTKSLPGTNDQAGLPSPEEYNKQKFISRLEIMSNTPARGAITITFKIPGSSAHDKKLQLIPAITGGRISWTCLPPDDGGISVNQVPPNCRG